jgi:Protein of unknown function (DUF1579)
MTRTRVTLAIALFFIGSTALAQHGHGDEKKPPFDAAMMEAMTKAGTPGDAHRKLDAFTGSWTAKIRSWMAPGEEPMVMDGSAETRWVMDGRYVEERFKGSFMGAPFDGLGYTGYDNVRKQYWSTWMDSMSTAIFHSTGAMGDAKTFNFTGMMPDPMTGKDMRTDTKIILTDADHHTTEMWAPAQDGKPYKMMEIVYTRKK